MSYIPFIILGNSDGCFKVSLSGIKYCTSYNSSTVFHLESDRKPIVIARSITHYENVLSAYGFVRIHHSTLLNIDFMCYIGKGEDVQDIFLTTGERLLVSRSRKATVMNLLKCYSVEQDDREKVQDNVLKKQKTHKSRMAKTR